MMDESKDIQMPHDGNDWHVKQIDRIGQLPEEQVDPSSSSYDKKTWNRYRKAEIVDPVYRIIQVRVLHHVVPQDNEQNDKSGENPYNSVRPTNLDEMPQQKETQY